MTDISAARSKWRLSQPAFDRFLAALDDDRDIAADRYEQIRSKLVRFFEWRGCTFPEERADETITRVIRKLDEGDSIQDPGSYCYGVARLVLLEAFKQQEKEREVLARFQPAASIPAADDEVEQRLECLRECVTALPRSQQDLITEYYRPEADDRIGSRRRLAERLGIGLNALRIRAHRLSDKLQSCVVHCVERSGAS